MAFSFNLSFGNPVTEPLSVERDNTGNWFYTIFGSRAGNKTFKTEQEKIDIILSNPACLKVFAINCDLFSLGKINTKDTEDYLRTLRRTPNYKQTWTQWEWDYMFWTMMGTAYLWKTGGKLLNDSNTLQWLNPAKIEWKSSTVNRLMDFILTKATYKEVTSDTIKYHLGNGKFQYIRLDEITPLHDLSSTTNNNFYKGISRVDALYKIISNSEQALDAKGINLEFSRKFIVSGANDENDVTKLPLSTDEREAIRERVRGGKSEIITKSPVTINRFITDMAALKLDEAYWADYYNIGSMFNIPKDILEIYNAKATTYENQEKSIVRHIEYVLKPKGQELTNALESMLDIEDTEMTWERLACYQVFEKEKQEVIKLKLENAILAKESKIKITDL
jgi:hypothetical protein